MRLRTHRFNAANIPVVEIKNAEKKQIFGRTDVFHLHNHCLFRWYSIRADILIKMVLHTFFLAGLLFVLQAATSPVPEISVDLKTRQTGANCSATTFSNLSGFILTEYQIDTVQVATTGSQSQTQTIATFGVLNPATGDTYRLDRIPITTGGGTWSVCRAGETPLPSTLQGCQYLVERGGQEAGQPGGRLGFRFQWLCAGANSSKPCVLC